MTDAVTAQYWARTVSPAAHAQAHPRPVQGCPGCPPVRACSWCGRPPADCPDLTGHRDLWVAGETSWRSGPDGTHFWSETEQVPDRMAVAA